LRERERERDDVDLEQHWGFVRMDFSVWLDGKGKILLISRASLGGYC